MHSDGTASYTPGVSRRTGTETRYFHTGLKNTDSLTNPSQTVAASRIYVAFGNVTSSSGTWSGPFGYAGNFGYQQDASGLKLLGHRYYDSSTGRFLTRDPIKDGRNWYAYGAGEDAPTVGSDPSGLLPVVVAYGLFMAISFCVALYLLNRRVRPAGEQNRAALGAAFENVGLESELAMPSDDTGGDSSQPSGTPALGDPMGTGDNIHDELAEVANVTMDGMQFQVDLLKGPYSIPGTVWEAFTEVFSTDAEDEVKKEIQDHIADQVVSWRLQVKP